MSHPRELLTCYRDPGVQRGPFKLLPYAPGGIVVFDTRAPLGQGIVGEPLGLSLASAIEKINALPLPDGWTETL